jgi:prepilin-type N-terminal cleavage/methylation domain-containing protein
MQISSNKNGFTLVEVLVVVLIIGLSLSVLFRLDYSPGPRQVNVAARAFAGAAELVLEEAVLSGDDWGIDFFIEQAGAEPVYGYRWLHYRDERWQEDVPVGYDMPALTRLDNALSLRLAVDGLGADIGGKVSLVDPSGLPGDFSPDVWLFPDHETTPFNVEFGHPDYASVMVASDMLGRIRFRESQP